MTRSPPSRSLDPKELDGKKGEASNNKEILQGRECSTKMNAGDHDRWPAEERAAYIGC